MSDPSHEAPAETAPPIDAQFEPAPRVKTKRSPGLMALIAAALLAAMAGGAGGFLTAGLTGSGSEGDSAASEARLEALETRLDSLAFSLESAGPAPAELAGLLGELDSVSRRLDEALAATPEAEAYQSLLARLEALEAAGEDGAPAASTRAIAALAERIAALETASAEAPAPAPPPDTTKAEAALALAAIESAARRGAGFEADYRALRAAVPGNAAARRLGTYVSGVESLSALQADFTPVREAVLAAAETPPSDSRLSWLDRVMGEAVSVRPAESARPVQAILDRAGAALGAGDLAGTIEALAGLQGAPARAAEDWTRRANRRISFEKELDAVRFSLIESED